MTLRLEDAGEQVRRMTYEVKELSATELRRYGGRSKAKMMRGEKSMYP